MIVIVYRTECKTSLSAIRINLWLPIHLQANRGLLSVCRKWGLNIVRVERLKFPLTSSALPFPGQCGATLYVPILQSQTWQRESLRDIGRCHASSYILCNQNKEALSFSMPNSTIGHFHHTHVYLQRGGWALLIFAESASIAQSIRFLHRFVVFKLKLLDLLTSSLATRCNSSLASWTRSRSVLSYTNTTALVEERYCVQLARSDACPPTSHSRNLRFLNTKCSVFDPTVGAVATAWPNVIW